MFPKKAIDLLNGEEIVTIEEHVEKSDTFKNLNGSRIFGYEMNNKLTKAKLIKGAKRKPIELEKNKTSSNMIYSVGAWHKTVLPTINYWRELKDDLTCKVGDYTIKVGGVKEYR